MSQAPITPPTAASRCFPPGTLWQQIQERTQKALACGALQSIPTHADFLEQDGVTFLVRSLNTLARKEKAKQAQKKASASGRRVNPFLPYEEDLFVMNLTDTHLCLLNKYNVVDHHLLIVTRAFEEQETWLNRHDFEALWLCMAEIDGLAFYNGGALAGASQPHKHLQLVPMPLSPKGSAIPIEPVLLAAPDADAAKSQSGDSARETEPPMVPYRSSLPFTHAVIRFDLTPTMPSQAVKHTLLNAYEALLAALDFEKPQGSDRQTGAYNLLITRRWMMMVPRSQESYASISVNSLGFAGSLFVSSEEQMKILTDHGPMNLLQGVARP